MTLREALDGWAPRLQAAAAEISARTGESVESWAHTLGERCGYDGFTLGLESGDLVLDVEIAQLSKKPRLCHAQLQRRNGGDYRSLPPVSPRSALRNLPRMIRTFERWLRRGPGPDPGHPDLLIGGPELPQRTLPFRPALGDEPDLAVFRAAIEHLFPEDPVVVVRHTGHETTIDQEAYEARRDEFETQGVSVTWTSASDYSDRLPGLDPRTCEAAFPEAQLMLDVGFRIPGRRLVFTEPYLPARELYRREPRAQGILWLFRPLINPETGQAILFLSNSTGLDPQLTDDFHALLLLEGQGDAWTVTSQDVLRTWDQWQDLEEHGPRLSAQLRERGFQVLDEDKESFVLVRPEGGPPVRVLTTDGLEALVEAEGTFVSSERLLVLHFMHLGPLLAGLEALDA